LRFLGEIDGTARIVSPTVGAFLRWCHGLRTDAARTGGWALGRGRRRANAIGGMT
jgi:hypothetical protein